MNEKIDWPSDRVAQGGIFHPHKVTYSKETHDLIKGKSTSTILMEPRDCIDVYF